MADPLSILGRIQICATLAKDICYIVQTIIDLPDYIKGIAIDIEYDSLVLQKFLKFFEEHNDALAEDVRLNVKNMTAMVNANLLNVRTKLQERQQGRSKLKRLTWPWAKPHLLEAEASLARWVEKINVAALNEAP